MTDDYRHRTNRNGKKIETSNYCAATFVKSPKGTAGASVFVS